MQWSSKLKYIHNACTLVPTVFRWHGKSISIFRFSFSHDIEKQIWILLFVFRFRLTFKNAFELRFSFLHHFEKRIWISFFVFTSLWKTDLNFVFVWLVIWKTDLNFVCCYCTTLEKRITAPVIWSPRTPEFTFYAKESNWAGPNWVVNSPAPMICPPHTVLLFNKGWQIIWW